MQTWTLYCACGHSGTVPASALPGIDHNGNVPPAVWSRMRCTGCGRKGRPRQTIRDTIHPTNGLPIRLGTTPPSDRSSGMITIRPVTFAETGNVYRTVTEADAMGRALLARCDPGDPAYKRAAASCIALGEGTGDPEEARADFIAALRAAGVFVRE